MMNKQKEEKTIENNINRRGFGIIPKEAMCSDLTRSAKAIYALLRSYSGTKGYCYPTVEKICYDLRMHRSTYYRHINSLIENGYISVVQSNQRGRFGCNTFIINSMEQDENPIGQETPNEKAQNEIQKEQYAKTVYANCEDAKTADANCEDAKCEDAKCEDAKCNTKNNNINNTNLKKKNNKNISFKKRESKDRSLAEKSDNSLELGQERENVLEIHERCGNYGNVLLKKSQFEELKAEFPYDFAEKIKRLDEYIEVSGKTYQNHLAVIRLWAEQDKVKSAPPPSRPSRNSDCQWPEISPDKARHDAFYDSFTMEDFYEKP